MVRILDPWPDPLDGDDPPVGVSIHPLDTDQLPTTPPPPPPAPTVPGPPPSTGRRTTEYGTPGASAMAQYRRHRRAELGRYLRTLPLRLAAVTLAGLLAGLVIPSTSSTSFAVLPALTMTVVLVYLLRFRVSAETAAWRRGAKGEQRTARHLRRLGPAWAVFHDLAIPGSRANADHLAIGPTGVFLIDTKHYRGRLTLSPEGSLWYGHYPLAGVLATVRWEAIILSQTLGTTVTPMLCVHGAQLPWGELMAEDIPVLAAGKVLTTLRALPPLDEVQAALVAGQARCRLRPAS
jgi:hypothetical protein